MKYYIIAGEASGDLHGSNLIKELKLLDSTATFRCWGGDKMQAAGASLVKHYSELAFMGFIEVVMNLRTIFKNLSFCKTDILQHQPEALILIDYPGFNLRMAAWAKQQGFKVIYYISPQVWAWKENRVKAIKKNVDKMLVILPFEKDFYAKWQYEVEYVGHPLAQVIDSFKEQDPAAAKEKIIAVLPGSRKQEITTKLPIMLAVANKFPGYRFVVAKAPGIEAAFYDDFLKDHSNVQAVSDSTYSLLSKASAALVTSGTATLETALFAVPEVVCYKGSAISYAIARRLITIKYICLVNLIMDKPVVKELIQDELTAENIEKELHELLNNKNRQLQLQDDFKALKQLLSAGGNASANAAISISKFLSK
jgi:lipid-A-disaccharide synthase